MPKDLYRQKYFEVLDLAAVSITDRFYQPGFKVYSNLEPLLFKVCSGNELGAVCDYYGADINRSDLESQLKTLQEKKRRGRAIN